MKAATISQLKQEMKHRTPNELLELNLRLAKFKKENKELLTYLLFEMQDEQLYIESIKKEMNQLFGEINNSNVYFVKKSIRRIVRITNKFIKYSGNKQTEVELLIHFCRKVSESGIPLDKSMALKNIYSRHLQKIKKAISTLHEDLQHDYGEELKSIRSIY
ncbi:MAG: hypothetical protein R2764_10045 [Bacteroidales bacterium]